MRVECVEHCRRLQETTIYIKDFATESLHTYREDTFLLYHMVTPYTLVFGAGRSQRTHILHDKFVNDMWTSG